MIEKKRYVNQFLFFLIFAVAFILRFWNFSAIPYMHDELSALGRTLYSSVNDVIIYGSEINDTHPPGVQVFLYYWTKLFGTNEMIVKFPFIVCGLLSVLLTYKIAKNWFNVSVALVTGSFMAVLQYPVMYSQLSRPYATGLFFCLLLVFCWSKFLFDESHPKKWLTGFTVAAICCAYNHHFTLLFAFIVGLSGIPFLNKEIWKTYFLSGIFICLFYLPNVPILLFQLSKGGLGGEGGWLTSPDSGWLYTYLKYVFHFSHGMYALGFIIIAWSIFWNNKEIRKTNKFRILCVTWFFLFFFIQYFYSVSVSAIIQFSTLLFAFPFLLMFLFSLYDELNVKKNAILVLLILIAGTSSLALERKHFQVFYHQPFQQQVAFTEENVSKISSSKDVTVEIIVPFYLKPILKKHYLERLTVKFDETNYGSIRQHPTPKAFRSFVNSRNTNYFIIGGDIPSEYVQIVKDKYPYLVDKEEGFTYSIYCFSKQKTGVENPEEIVFEKTLISGKSDMDSTTEYGQPFLFKLKEMVYNRHTEVLISVKLSPQDSSSDPVLVGTIEENGKQIEWRGSNYFDYNDNKAGNKLILSIPLTSFDFKKYPEAELKIYVWNKDKKNLRIEDLNLKAVRSNPLIYGLYEPLD